MLEKKEIKTHIIPEECLYCSVFLLKAPRHVLPHTMILKSLTTNSHDYFLALFQEWYQENRAELLEFVTTALSYTWEDEGASSKLVKALIHAIGESKKGWVLEELTLHPQSFPHILHSSLRIPPHLTFTFWGIFATFEEAWSFWESMLPAAKRRIHFRCLRFKEELIARAWHPDRFLAWCSDQEERQEIWDSWEIRI